jgi:ceramide glucosyltransferase
MGSPSCTVRNGFSLGEVFLATLLAGAVVYSLMVIFAAHRYQSACEQSPRGMAPASPGPPSNEPVSILKPLSGLDSGLESNLRTFFEQDYRDFEILFAVRHVNDPAVAVVEKLQGEYPGVRSRLLLTGDPPYPNAKVFSLDRMLAAAEHNLIVMSDSDIRVGPDLLRTVAGEFRDPALGVATCPYRAVAGRSFWSRIEAIGMNTDFLAGILVARMLEGMRFAVGPTVVARRGAIESIGGFDRLKDYLAEDFALGKFAAEAGQGVGLSSYVVEHHIGSQGLAHNARHRLRWARSTRRSRPAGYFGQLFTLSLPLAALLVAVCPAWWPLLPFTLTIRAAAAWTVSRTVLGARINWVLLPVEDAAACLTWVAGFFGNSIDWRGQRYQLAPDGRFVLLAEAYPAFSPRGAGVSLGPPSGPEASAAESLPGQFESGAEAPVAG